MSHEASQLALNTLSTAEVLEGEDDAHDGEEGAFGELDAGATVEADALDGVVISRPLGVDSEGIREVDRLREKN